MQAAIKKQPGSRARKPECGSRNGSEISEIREGREAPPIAIRFLYSDARIGERRASTHGHGHTNLKRSQLHIQDSCRSKKHTKAKADRPTRIWNKNR